MAWTDERIERLKTMWEKGMTASQIAEDLGGVSRNAVIGKAHRLGLQARPSPVKPNEPVAVVARPTETAAPVPDEAPAAVAEEHGAVASVMIVDDNEVDSADAHAANVAALAVEAGGDDVEDGDETGADEDVPATKPGPRLAEFRPTPPPSPYPPAVPSGPTGAQLRSVGPGGFLRQGPGDQAPPAAPAPPRRLVPARPNAEMADKTTLLELTDKICKWPLGHPGEPDFHFCGDVVNPGFPYCVAHCGQAYQAQLPRRDRRGPPPLPFGGPRVR